jgi:hypothetical protein
MKKRCLCGTIANSKAMAVEWMAHRGNTWTRGISQNGKRFTRRYTRAQGFPLTETNWKRPGALACSPPVAHQSIFPDLVGKWFGAFSNCSTGTVPVPSPARPGDLALVFSEYFMGKMPMPLRVRAKINSQNWACRRPPGKARKRRNIRDISSFRNAAGRLPFTVSTDLFEVEE